MPISLRPTALQKGDTIGIVAPAGQLQDKNRFIEGVRILGEMGFEVKFPRNLWPGTAYLADNDQARALELNSLLGNPDIKGLIALRGGYGCLRILDKIDLSLVTRDPKIVVGFSDITILQNYLYEQTGLVSLHGPVVTSLAGVTRQSLESLFHCLTGDWSQPAGSAALDILHGSDDAEGVLIGGNLASMATLLGTRFDSSWDRKIVFLEDTNEPLYKLDRLLTQLKLAGKLDNIAGLILGDFSLSEAESNLEKIRYREAVWNRVLELFSGNRFPIWGGFPSGHCPDNHTFPLGAMVQMKAKTGRLSFTLP